MLIQNRNTPMTLIELFSFIIIVLIWSIAWTGLCMVTMGLIHALFFHKPIFEEHEIVLVYGVKGTIIHIYPNNTAYEIEVIKNDKTEVVKTVKAEYVKKIVKL